MAYADFTYYRDEYCGVKITVEKEFNRYARRASAIVDQVTYGRLTSIANDDIPEEVYEATCALVDKLYDLENSVGSTLTSESNDGYSVSFRDTGDDQKQRKELYATIRTYLDNTGLLYRGISWKYDLRNT